MQRIILLAAVVLACVFLSATSAQAATCSNATLTTTYGYTEIGAPWNAGGLYKFDGKGNVTNSWTIVYSDGTTNIGTQSWTYSVNSDCTFTVTNDRGQQYFGVIVLGGQQLEWVIGTDGFVAKGEAFKLGTTQNQN